MLVVPPAHRFDRTFWNAPFRGDGQETRLQTVNHSSPDAQDRHLDPLAPGHATVGVKLRQPDVPGGKRGATVENLRERAAFAFKGRQIVALLSRRQSAALPFCPCGGVVVIHQLGSRQKPDRFIVGRVDAAVNLVFVNAIALYIADLQRAL